MRILHCLLVSTLLLIGQGLLAQSTEFTGKVIDPSAAPIPNANDVSKFHFKTYDHFNRDFPQPRRLTIKYPSHNRVMIV